MNKFNLANVKKTLYYLKRNGIAATFYAAKERMESNDGSNEENPYTYCPPTSEEMEKQRNFTHQMSPLISILVPAYHTPKVFLEQLIDSLLEQTYREWELILADASSDDQVKKIADTYKDKRICYLDIKGNEGISVNSNKALKAAKGSYIGLLDHDDFLAPDALFWVVQEINQGYQKGYELSLIYTDEDKSNQYGSVFYSPHNKEKFNLDLILSNNYICHFMVINSALLKKLEFRKEYDGAQDYDLVLRVVGELLTQQEEGKLPRGQLSDYIRHIPKVLYHWRCHDGSTAENPASKEYAYKAGASAVQDFVNQRKYNAKVYPLKHLGFYGQKYKDHIFHSRKDIAAIGGKLIKDHKITGGIYREDGTILYEGLNENYSGYMNRAVLCQNADAVDIRCIQVREECFRIFEQVVGISYEQYPGEEIFDYRLIPEGTDYVKLSIRLCKTLREAGYHILWNPETVQKIFEQ
ncbi:glycosyltransferase [Lachnospiraceae bacterium OttesenSCG-928-D06]|nr:glycosyltransferase [Lachnospiraceae bacterium OttesenSCG-928-D06]